MGTNYYRIPTESEVLKKKETLNLDIKQLDTSPAAILYEFRGTGIDQNTHDSPWEKFMNCMLIHLGKRSGGWKFIWNFHKEKYYTNKEELLKFIRSGRVVNEYGEKIDQEEFIEMALNWAQPNGYDLVSYYKDHPTSYAYSYGAHETYIDGLRVSTSTDFC